MVRFFCSIVAIFFLLAFSMIAWRLRPVMGPKESYNSFFPSQQFLAKLAQPMPDWIEKQLDSDFKEVKEIRSEALEKAYATIFPKLQKPTQLYHYRILDNQLYKFVPEKVHLSARDYYYEKALKTMMSFCRLPDLDFILCPMDGVPEAMIDPHFYFMDNPEDQVPILGQAKLKEPLTKMIVLIPDQLSLSEDWYHISKEILLLNEKIPWDAKTAKAFWRGGMSDRVEPNIPKPRLTICRLSKQFPEWIDAASGYDSLFLDLAISEGLPQCHVYVTKEEHLRHKYLPVLNGNMCTYPGYQWRLLSNCLALKQESDQVQWFYAALKPDQHYLPIAFDMSDLLEKVKWAKASEEKVQKMISNARKFALENLMYEDIYRYFYLVLQRYASLQKIDFKKLKKATKKDPRWVNIHYRKRLEFYKKLHKTIAHFSYSRLNSINQNLIDYNSSGGERIYQ